MEKYNEEKYSDHYNLVPIEDMIIIINEKEYEQHPINETNTYYYGELTNSSYLKISETLKFKIEGIDLKHKLEIFQINYSEFFSCVSKFHLPCVRAYYNGTNVYMLPSAITAYMTYINIDYKYFAGSKDPIEIINKYKPRGYGTLENDKEKIHHISYNTFIKKWSNSYNISSIVTKKSEKKIFKIHNLNNIIYKPKECNPHLYNLESKPTDYNFIDYQIVESYNNLVDEYSIINNCNIDYFLKYTTINQFGYVNPIKLWIIDAFFEFYKNGYINSIKL
jgi:hypothetical protein